jgi:hypothetical protein
VAKLPLKTFKDFAAEKSANRSLFTKSSSKKGKNPEEFVTISVGICTSSNDIVKPVRGKYLPLKIGKSASAETLLSEALKKRYAYDNAFKTDRSYRLCYPDGSKAQYLPGTKEKFRLAKYNEEYARVVVLLCPVMDLRRSPMLTVIAITVEAKAWTRLLNRDREVTVFPQLQVHNVKIL